VIAESEQPKSGEQAKSGDRSEQVGKSSGGKVAKAASKRERSDSDDDDDGEADDQTKRRPAKKRPRSTKAAAASAPLATAAAATSLGQDAGSAADGKAGAYEMVMEAMRKQQTVVMDSRWNLTYMLPKKSKIAMTQQQWRQVVSGDDKLTSNVVCVDPNTLVFEEPLEVVDIQPLRASPNASFLTVREINLKSKNLLNTSILIGSRFSLNRNTKPVTGTLSADFEQKIQTNTNNAGVKRTVTPGEWVVWLRSGNKPGAPHIPMTIATFAELIREKRLAQPLVVTSEHGWATYSEDDRMFLVPRDFLPENNTATLLNDTPDSLPAKPTPAISLSQSASAMLPDHNPPPADPAIIPATIPAVIAARADPPSRPEPSTTDPPPTDASSTVAATANV
jgi:hypothetical protein